MDILSQIKKNSKKLTSWKILLSQNKIIIEHKDETIDSFKRILVEKICIDGPDETWYFKNSGDKNSLFQIAYSDRNTDHLKNNLGELSNMFSSKMCSPSTL